MFCAGLAVFVALVQAHFSAAANVSAEFVNLAANGQCTLYSNLNKCVFVFTVAH